MLQHARDKGHHFRKEDVTILSKEQDWVRWGILEAIHIKALSPSINIDPGRHALSSHFDAIIADNIKPPPAPAPHNPENEHLINTAPRRQGRPKQPAPLNQQTVPKQQLQTQQTLPKQQPPVMRRSQRIRDMQQ